MIYAKTEEMKDIYGQMFIECRCMKLSEIKKLNKGNTISQSFSTLVQIKWLLLDIYLWGNIHKVHI